MKTHKFLARRDGCAHRRFAIAAIIVTCFAATARADVPANDNPTGPCGQFNGNVTTGCSYDPYTANVTRSITDIIVAGGTGAYPLAFTRTMTSRYVPGLSTEFGEAGSWRHSYQWTIDAVTVANDGDRPAAYNVNYPDGRRVRFSDPNVSPNPPRWKGMKGVRDRFEHLSSSHPYACYLVLPDGGQISFQAYHPNGNLKRWAFTFHAIIDPYNYTTYVTYGTDQNGPYMKITEPAYRWLKIYYRQDLVHPNDPTKDIVSHVDASDGRTVSYGYTLYQTPNGTPYTSLTQVRYFGNQWWDAFYTYQNSNLANNPNDRPLIRTCIDPMFDGPMWMIAYSFVPNSSVYGQLQSEKYFNGSNVIGPAVSTLGVSGTTRTETRGDRPNPTSTPTRTFTYNGSNNSPRYALWKVTDFFNGVIAKQTYDGNGYLSDATDRNGNRTTYECKGINGNIKRITSATPSDVIPPNTPTVIEYKYPGDGGCPDDPNNNDPDNPYYVKCVTNGPSYVRNLNKQIQTITYPNTGAGQSTEEFTYNQYGQVRTHKMRNGFTESWTYDPNNPSRVSEYRDGAHQDTGAPTASYLYDGRGRVWKITDGANHTTIFEYTARGQLQRLTHPDGTGTFIQYFYYANGTLWATTDERRGATTDASKATVYTYDDYKRLRTVTTPRRGPNDSLPRITTYYYDQNGIGEDHTRTADVPTKVVSPLTKVVTTTYDNNLRATYVTAFGDGNDPPDAVTHYTYDNNGNVRTIDDPRHFITTYYYDELDRVQYIDDPIPGDRNEDGHTMRFWYDPSGNLAKQKRADNKTCTFSYDAMGFMTERYGYGNEHTKYVPDLAGNLYRYKFDKGGGTDWVVYQYEYDKVNRLKTVTYPADWHGDQRYEQYEYDIANHLWRYTNPAVQQKTLTYDARGRLQDTVWSGSGNLAPSVHIEYDAASRPQYITSGNTRLDFVYDEANNRVWELQTVDGIANAVRTDPDADGNRADLMVYPWRGNYTPVLTNYFDYTSRNELRNINDSNHNGFFKYSYDAAGNVTKRQRQGWQDRTEAGQPYDGLNRPLQCDQYDHNGSRFDWIQYYYKNVGNLWHTVRSDYGSGNGDWFGYDDINQLGTAVYKATSLDSPDTPNKRVTYMCGARNRLSMTVDDNVNNQHYTTAYDHVDLNQYPYIHVTANGTTTDYALTWDNNFNLQAYNGSSYTYDSENRLVLASSPGHNASFVYDAVGRCVKRTIDTVTRIITYDQWTPVAEWDGGGSSVATNVFGLGDDEILYRKAGSAQYYYRSDAMGNVKFIQDGNGALVERYDYDAFSKPTIYPPSPSATPIPNSAVGNRFMFSGREYFSELGLYDMRNRVYDPVMGRFYQTDPIGFEGDPLNLYRFCGNNPLLGGDQTGLDGLDTGSPMSFDQLDGSGIFSDFSSIGQDWLYSGGFGPGLEAWASLDDPTYFEDGLYDFAGSDKPGGYLDAGSFAPPSSTTFEAFNSMFDTSSVNSSSARAADFAASFQGGPMAAAEGTNLPRTFGLVNDLLDIGAYAGTHNAEKLQKANKFALNGRIYKAGNMGFKGNQRPGFKALDVAAAKIGQGRLATAGQLIGRLGTYGGLGLAALEVYEGGASNRSLMKASVGLSAPFLARIPPPYVGVPLAIGAVVTDSVGGFNGFFNKFDNTPRFGPKPPPQPQPPVVPMPR